MVSVYQFIIQTNRELGKIYKKGCRCSESLRAKDEGENLTHTRWSGGMGYLRRVKWIRDEKFFFLGRECECVIVKI